MFHENLKLQRLKMGLSQKQVAEYLNISPQSVSKWENGDALPSIEFLPGLSEILSCEINDFFAKETVQFDFSLLTAFFSLHVECWKDKLNLDPLYDFYQEQPKSFEMANAFIDEISKNKIVTIKTIQAILSCSEVEAKQLLLIIEKMSVIERCDEYNCWVVDNERVEGVKQLFKADEQIITGKIVPYKRSKT